MSEGWIVTGRCLLIGALASTPGFAQSSGGMFRGAVRDPSNAAVLQAIILIRSHSDGPYITPALVRGSYLLTDDGFKTTQFGPVILQVDQTVRVDFALSVGAASDSVQVQASGEQLLSTENSQVSQLIASKQVSERPLNGRQWQQLISLSAGVNPGALGEGGSPNPVNVDGLRSKANLYLGDGLSTTSSAQGRTNNVNISLDAVNNALNAANVFSNATGQVPSALRYNQFGGATL